MKAKRITAAVVAAGLLATVGLTACGSTEDTASQASSAASEAVSEASSKADAAAAPGEAAGFTEYPIGEDQEVGGIMNVAAVYFQPVDLEPATQGLSAEEADIHLEADVSALENDLGYGTGDWIPYMTVDYEIIDQDTEKTAAEGTFMVMNASDGPHYGANIKLPKAGTYTLKLKFHTPEDNGYLLHVDAETGVTGRFWKEPLTCEFKDWEYTPQEW